MKRNHLMAILAGAVVITAGSLAMPESTRAQAASVEASGMMAEVSPLGVTFGSAGLKAAGRVAVRVSGPQGEIVYEAESDGGMIDWYPDSSLPDGAYTYDLWVMSVEAIAERAVRAVEGMREPTHDKSGARQQAYGSGMLRIQNGFILEHSGDAAGANWQEVSSSSEPETPGLVASIAAGLLDWIVPAAHADVTITDPTPEIYFQDTSGGTTNDWIILGYDGSPPLFGIGQTLFPQFGIFGGAPIASLMIGANGNIGIGHDSPAANTDIHVVDDFPVFRFEDSSQTERQIWDLYADDGSFSVRDIKAAGTPFPFLIRPNAPNNSLFVQGTTGNVGLGTGTPASKLHVMHADGSGIRLDNVLGETFLLGAGQGPGGGQFGFYLHNSDTGNRIFDISAGAPSNVLIVDGTGNTGMGTSSPSTALHVSRTGGTAATIRAETTGGSTTVRQLFQLANNGFPAFNLTDDSQADVSWTFRISGTQGSDERFTITKLGTGQPEFALFADGSAEFQGNVTANGVQLTSSRELKTDFSSVDEHTLLEKVAALDVSQWRYKREPGTERHIGPMAEDFREVFGLGDGRHISAGDAQGILFAAAKALKVENDALRGELAELRTAVAELQNPR